MNSKSLILSNQQIADYFGVTYRQAINKKKFILKSVSPASKNKELNIIKLSEFEQIPCEILVKIMKLRKILK